MRASGDSACPRVYLLVSNNTLRLCCRERSGVVCWRTPVVVTMSGTTLQLFELSRFFHVAMEAKSSVGPRMPQVNVGFHRVR